MSTPFHVVRVRKWVTKVAPTPREVSSAEDQEDHPEDCCEPSELLDRHHNADRSKHKKTDENTLGSDESGNQTCEREIQQVACLSLFCEHDSLRQQPGDSYGEREERGPEIGSCQEEAGTDSEIRRAQESGNDCRVLHTAHAAVDQNHGPEVGED